MELVLQHISKRFGNSWILKDINGVFRSGEPCAITGRNGSGKSTLLKIVSGGMVPTTGSVTLTQGQQSIPAAEMARLVSYAAPYTELIERLTLEEHLRLHFRFCRPVEGIDTAQILEHTDLTAHRTKEIRDFSSGMKQRLKLALAFYTDTPVMLLDEPTSNLDRHWIEWYGKEVRRAVEGRIVIIASNVEEEYAFCREVIDLSVVDGEGERTENFE